MYPTSSSPGSLPCFLWEMKSLEIVQASQMLLSQCSPGPLSDLWENVWQQCLRPTVLRWALGRPSPSFPRTVVQGRSAYPISACYQTAPGDPGAAWIRASTAEPSSGCFRTAEGNQSLAALLPGLPPASCLPSALELCPRCFMMKNIDFAFLGGIATTDKDSLGGSEGSR